ncbi:MAG: hypothetical protein ACE5JI_14040, partial [Acidobacteriota bacterium]
MDQIMIPRVSKSFLTACLILGAGGLLAACSSGTDSPASITITISAPGIVSPTSGEQVGSTPTLTVANVTVSDGSTPTYTFQVATDSAFANIVAQASGIAQGSGQTSWEVTGELDNGQHFWRARAQAGSTLGPFSAVAEFSVTGGAVKPDEGAVLFEPLTTGTTLAIARRGGELTEKGWKVTSNHDFLRYEVDAISSGWVQWQNTGLLPRGFNDDSHMLFGMWDP